MPSRELLDSSADELAAMREEAEKTGYYRGVSLGALDHALGVKRAIEAVTTSTQTQPTFSSRRGRAPRGARYVDDLVRTRMGRGWGRR